MEKIDLRKKAVGEYPPDVAKLIEQCGGVVNKAEKLAGFGQGLFAKVRRGESSYTDYIRTRVEAALAGNPIPRETQMKKPDAADLPETCPPLLAELIRHCGTKKAAVRILGTSDATLYGVINGKEMPQAWVLRAKAQLGHSVIGTGVDQTLEATADGPSVPFVPWDGKSKGIFKTRAHGKSKSRTIKNVPQPLLDLLAKNNDIVQRASAALGVTGNTLFKWMEGVTFTEDRQRIVHKAMHGKPTGVTNSMGEQFDKYSLGIAICLMRGANYDRVHDIAEILQGRLIFRKNTSAGWIIMYKMSIDDLPKFKKLAIRDAHEIVCP